MMNFKDWPVVEMSEFQSVVIDVTKWGDKEYTAMFNFFKQYADDETGQRGEGYSICTHLGGENIREIHDKIDILFSIGFFDGVEVDAHGTLFDEDHNELDGICWNQYCDEDFDDEDITSHHSAPVMFH